MPFPDEFMVPQDPSLVRVDLIGTLARAARLALSEFEHADSVTFNVEATPDGLSVDCQLLINGQPVGGWGV